ncbi:MAG TPA: hypothetical protein VEF89_05865 [Solirubrobacteraceae bacterium]|nr:hypothetical protein [Solirubrobacteraceae bacterium]
MPSERETCNDYTHINLADVVDAAVENGFGHRWGARVAREPLRAQQTGLVIGGWPERPRVPRHRPAPSIGRSE